MEHIGRGHSSMNVPFAILHSYVKVAPGRGESARPKYSTLPRSFTSSHSRLPLDTRHVWRSVAHEAPPLRWRVYRLPLWKQTRLKLGKILTDLKKKQKFPNVELWLRPSFHPVVMDDHLSMYIVPIPMVTDVTCGSPLLQNSFARHLRRKSWPWTSPSHADMDLEAG